MREAPRIGDLFRRAFEGGGWHGPSVSRLLEDVTADVATRRPIANAHNIWEIVLHLNAWHQILLRRLAGEMVRGISDTEDWPPLEDTSQEAWQRALREFRQSYEQVRTAISSLSDERLAELLPGVDTDWTVYVTLHGLIHHDLYHAGQIAILKKA